MKKQVLRTFALISALVLIGSFSFSQIRETGTIQGYIYDDAGAPLPGATVTIESPNILGGARTVVTGSSGFFRFHSLLTEEYSIKAGMPGFNTLVKKGIKVSPLRTFTVDFRLTIAPVTEEVIVVGERPTVDIKTSAPGGAVMTEEYLMSVPIKSSRDFIELVPGAFDGLSAYGTGSEENVWSIDGIMADTVYYGGWHYRPQYNIIKEASVQGLGLPAEYGEFTGAVLNIVTRSGSNTFSGMFEVMYHGENWNSQNSKGIPLEQWRSESMYTRKYQTGDFIDYGLMVGGKILRDKLWFMISGNYQRKYTYPRGVEEFQTSRYPKLFIKVNSQLNRSNKVHGVMNWTEEWHKNYMLSLSFPADVAPESHYPRWSGSVGWTSILSPKTLLDVKFGYFYQLSHTYPQPGKENVPGGYDTGYGKTVDNTTWYQEEHQRRYQLIAHLNHYIPDLWGDSHDIKLGGEVIWANANMAWGPPGGIEYTYFYGEPVSAYESATISRDYYLRTIVGFIQDSWTNGKRLTINWGLRWNNYWYKNPAEGLGVMLTANALAPRVGFAFDLLGDRKNVLKFHYGHFFKALRLYGLNTIENRYEEETAYEWDPVLNDWVVSWATTPAPYRYYEMDDNITYPYIGEFVVGFERELFRNASLEINVYHRDAKAFMGIVALNAHWDKVDALSPGPDGIFDTADDHTIPYYERDWSVEPVYNLITNPEKEQGEAMLDDLYRTQKGIEIIFNKRYSNRWQLSASYAYGTSRGNSRGGWGAGLWANNANDPNTFVFASGLMPYWGEPHHFKISGSVLLPLDIQVGFRGYLVSGTPSQSSANIKNPVTGEIHWGVAVMEVGEGYKSQARKFFDVRLEKRLNLGRRKQLNIRADISNVFNFHTITRYYTTYGPLYGKVTRVQNPRVYSIAFRFIW